MASGGGGNDDDRVKKNYFFGNVPQQFSSLLFVQVYFNFAFYTSTKLLMQ